MNFKIFLSVIALAVTTVAAQPAARADEGGGGNMRWKFAPNVYRLEEPTGPRHHAFHEPPAQQVRRGQTPGVHNMLGFNPATLKKPVAAVPQQQPNVMAQLVPPGFNNLFGKPTSTGTAATAQAKPLTALMAPTASTLAPSRPAVKAPVRRMASNNNVMARMRRPARSQSHNASAGPIASYGQGVGYIPGSTAPGVTGGSGGANATVNGKLIRH